LSSPTRPRWSRWPPVTTALSSWTSTARPGSWASLPPIATITTIGG